MSKPVSISSPGCLRIIKFLTAKPRSTTKEISEGAFMAYRGLRNEYVKKLIMAELIHHSGYRRTGGGFANEYSAGRGLNDPSRPKRLDDIPTHVNAKNRRNRRRSGELEMKRANRLLARPKDPILVALLFTK